MHAQVPALNQRNQVAQGTLIKLDFRGQFMVVAAAAPRKQTHAAAGAAHHHPVRAGRFARKGEKPPPRAGILQLQVQVSVGEIEDRLGFARLKVDPPLAHLDPRKPGDAIAGQQFFKVPLALLLDQIDDRLVPAQGGEPQPASPQRPPCGAGFQGLDPGERLDAERRILGDHDFLDGDSRPAKQVQADGANLHAPPERGLDRRPDRFAVLVQAEVGRGQARDAKQRQPRQQEANRAQTRPGHRPAPPARRSRSFR